MFFGAHCLDPASEHLASLFFCAQFGDASAAEVPTDRKRPGVITALTSDRSAPGLIRQGTDTDPRPCTGAVLLTGNDSRCQPNFVDFGSEPTRYCEANPGRRPRPRRRRARQGSPPACPWPRVLIRSRHAAVALEKRGCRAETIVPRTEKAVRRKMRPRSLSIRCAKTTPATRPSAPKTRPRAPVGKIGFAARLIDAALGSL